MSHLLSLFLLVLLPARGCSREEPQKLCAHNFIRALVWVCGGPRWASPEGRQSTSGDREILQLLQKRPFRGMAPDTNTEENLDVGLVWRPGLLADAGRLDRAHRWRRAPSPAKHCCNNGCTKQDLLTFCPH
ncbi:insulin-like 3 isoform X2 [Phascolarctos cinereus]|uniref:Insulin-like 3 n=1 Tax=Phascolarctos cinereus TaxID=38626 RepID=A0A6P5M289_PHACI|nr:insulin-like 3 isoform X1 [Phascolarctos cinereus]